MARARHFAYAAGWKKFEPLWDMMIRAKRVARMRPVLERVLGEKTRLAAGQEARVTQRLAPRSTSDISLKVFSP
jgi:hypothetical protein